MNKYTSEKRFLHGGDYNPDQWLNYPEILEKDLELMQKANTNTFSIGMFSWASLEPEEGKFNFKWLDKIMDDIASIGGNVILATPSGARPAWMSQKYPEVLRTNERREKMLHGGRHNHCFSSPVYREKVSIINRLLAERYKDHPGLLMWHISNEYSGECHCDYCQANFRQWVKNKYKTLDAVNAAWWGPFWSHTITDWNQIESPSPIGENAVHGLNLDWRRFVTDQTIDFYEHEIKDIRQITPNIPITTNFMADTDDLIPFQSLDYGKFSRHVDVISWDCYPAWHNDWGTTADLASKVGFINDQYRSLKQQPFLIMESTPSGVNWHKVNKTKRPGMHLLSSMQFIAHGSDSNLYFQWRKSRGSSEKFHGAVVDHDNTENNRVFKEVSLVGEVLEKIQEVKTSNKKANVAMIYDWENKWALDDAQGFGLETKRYPQTLQEHYRYFWDRDIEVDVVTKHHDLSKYQLVILPMLYMMDENTMKKLQEYVKSGGVLVSTYLTGLVNGSDLTYLGGWPQSLQELFGINVTETDTYYSSQYNMIKMLDGTFIETKDYQSIIELSTAEGIANYEKDFYAGTPAITVNKFGKGQAIFIGARTEVNSLNTIYDTIVEDLDLKNSFVVNGNPVVSVQSRTLANQEYYFVMNFSEQPQSITVLEETLDLITGDNQAKEISLTEYGVKVLKRR